MLSTATSLGDRSDHLANAVDDDPWLQADQLFAALASGGDAAHRRRARERIICQCAPLARREALRYRHTGESLEDLIQVAHLGLILAVDRFDPGRGVPFKHFAVPTICGELKRHFRDKGWSVKVSRRVQELYLLVNQSEPELAQLLGRMPTTRDLALHLRLTEEDICAARGGGAAYSARSLSWPLQGDDDGADLGSRLGALDRSLEAVADRDALQRAAGLLPQRLRHILALRFVDELSQAQIADTLGISQMHVSRLLSKSLAMLRGHMLAEQPTPAVA